ncbi:MULTISPECIES: SHOCT domain-containing protein [unclassified Microbacterium]|uniref:SHOCT domain-containing protein n=1 Tax=unclassified Microbacterium TaxID=2609290 RepID=UPI000EA9A705|nr:MULTISPECIES: PLDc N-terminal domain-containing protein [unclassified Microbacterium]MBT2485494.1 SHOCT domain-containing protein [Microbacterium sp. ISL-108]RKN68286.1 SHOCT domain-containing protein [Microbacterium sp. CGR2]
MSLWESFWAIIGWFFWAFVFISYLMVLFNIIADLFRDSAVKGWVKAIWMIFLVFVPFLTALVYLIARGGGMAERTASAYREQQHAADSYIRSVAGSSPSDEIDKASKLLAAGTITNEEFAAIKARALR